MSSLEKDCRCLREERDELLRERDEGASHVAQLIERLECIEQRAPASAQDCDTTKQILENDV